MRVASLCLVASLVLAVPAAATDARVRSLGGLPDAFEDDGNVLRWPGSLPDYVGQAHLDVRTIEDDGTTEAAGVNVALDARQRWGALAFAYADALPEAEPGGYFAAVYARRFGPVAAAATFRGTTFGTAANPPGAGEFASDARYLHDWGGGVRVDLADGFYLDAAGEVVRAEVEYDDDVLGISLHETSGQSVAARARGFARVSERIVVVPHVSYLHDVRPTVSGVLGGPADLSAWEVLAGVGLNLLVDPDNLVVVSGEYLGLEREWDARYAAATPWDVGWRDLWQIMVRVGFESRVLPWLTVRGGAVYRRHTDESYRREVLGEGAFDYDYGWDVRIDVPVVLGVGLHAGAFDVDLVVQDGGLLGPEEFPADLGDLPSGAVGAATLRYAF